MPNELIDFYRQQHPDDSISDQSILGGFLRQHGQSAIQDQYPDAFRQYAAQRRKDDIELYNRHNPSGLWGEWGKGVSRTWSGLKGTGAGAFALGAARFGWEGGRDYFLKHAMEYEEEASDISLAAAEGEWKDADGLYESLQYSASVFGEAFPSLAESLVLMVGGAVAGTAAAPGPGTVVGGLGTLVAKKAVKDLLKKKVSKLVKENLAKEVGKKTLTNKRVREILMKTALSGKGPGLNMVKAQMKAVGGRYGAALATGLNSYGLSSGEIYNSLASNPNVDPDDAINIAMVAGLVAAVPDTFLPGYILGKTGIIGALTGTVKSKVAKEHVKRRFNGYVARLAKGAAITIPAEGMTEGFQELVNIAAEKYGDKTSEHFKQTGSWFAPMEFYSDLTDEEKGRIDRAIVVGAAAGSMGAPISAISPSTRAEPEETIVTPKPAPPGDEVAEEIYGPTEKEKSTILGLVQRELAGDKAAVEELRASGMLSNRGLLRFYLAERENALQDQGFSLKGEPTEERGEGDNDHVEFLVDQKARVRAADLTNTIKKYLLADLDKRIKAAKAGIRPSATVSQSMARGTLIKATWAEEQEVTRMLDEQLGLVDPEPVIEDLVEDEATEETKPPAALLPETTGAEEVRNRERDERWQREDDAKEAERLSVQKSEGEKKLAVLQERLNRARETATQQEAGKRKAETSLAATWRAEQDVDKETERAAKFLEQKQEREEAKEKKATDRLLAKADAEAERKAAAKETKAEETDQEKAAKTKEALNPSHVEEQGEPLKTAGEIADRRSKVGLRQDSYVDISPGIWTQLKDKAISVLGNILTQGAGKKKAGKGLSKRDSRRITAFLNPDTGEVITTKTWSEKGEYWIAGNPDPDTGKPKKVKLSAAIEAGFIPIASILTKADANVKDIEKHATRNAYESAFAEIIAEAKVAASARAETKPETRERPVQVVKSQKEARNLSTLKQVKALFDAIIGAAVARGLNFEIFQNETAKMDGEYGSYANAYQLVRIALADAATPTGETIRLLLHEVSHAVFANEPVEVREAIHRAIKGMSDKALQLEGFTLSIPEGVNEAEVVQEERLVETTSIALQQEGFDPTVAQSKAQEFLRFLKDLYYRAAMAIQRATGLNIVSEELPLRYFQNRMRMFLSGDKEPFSYLSFLGGPKLNVAETVGVCMKVDDSAPDIDLSFRDMTIGHAEVIPDNKLAARLGVRYSGPRPSPKRKPTDPEPIVQQGEDYDSVQMKKGEVYSLKIIDGAYRKMYETWRTTGGEARGLTYEEWLSSRFVGEENPATLIAEINTALREAGQDEVNPDEVTSSSLDQVKQLPLQKEAAYRKLKVLRQKLLKNFNDAQEQLDPTKKKSLSWYINQAKEKLVIMVQKYTDADVSRTTLQTILEEAVGVLREDIRQIDNAARKKGELYQIIKQLEGRTPDARAMKQVENKLGKLVRDPNFFDMLQAAAEVLQDRDDSASRWTTLTAPEIAGLLEASGDPRVASLAKDRQLLAGVIAIGKKDVLVMDLLSIRRDTERGDVDALLAEVLAKGRADAATIRSTSRKLPRLEKVATRMLLELNKKQKELAGEQRKLQFEADKVLFWDSVAAVLDDQMARLEDDLGIETADKNLQAFALYDGAMIPVPEKEDTTIEDLRNPEKRKKVSLKAGQASQDALRIYYAKIKRWLIANEEKPKSATYRQMERISNELLTAAADLTEKGVRRVVTQKIFDAFSKAFFTLDSGIARLMGRHVENFQDEWQRMQPESDLLGNKWTLAERNLMKLVSKKIDDREAFRVTWYQAALQFFEKRPDLLAFSKEDKVVREHAYNKYLDHLRAAPEMKVLLENKKVREAFFRYLDATGESSQFYADHGERLNIRLSTDKKGGYLRKVIGHPIFTVMRRMSAKASMLHELMREKGWLDIKSDDPFDNSRPLFDETIWRDFVGAIVHKEGRPMLGSVRGSDGVTILARRSNIEEAYKSVKIGENGMFSIQAFAEELYLLEGGLPDDLDATQQFVEQTFLTFNDVFQLLHSQKQELSQANNDGNMGVPMRILMDTRKAEELPAEFMEHVTFDPRTMRQMTKMMAMEHAYGRNMSNMKILFTQLILELKDKKTKYEQISSEVAIKNPTASRRQRIKLIENNLKEEGLNPIVYANAADNFEYAQTLQQQWGNYTTSEGHVSTENKMAMEIVGTAAGATVQGFTTLILDLSAPLIQGQTKMSSLGGTSFAGSIYKKAFGEVLGSLWQLFGRTFAIKADNARRRARNGYIFADAHLRMQDRFVVALNEVNKNDRLLVEDGDSTRGMLWKRGLRGVLNLTRIVRTLLGSGLGKSKLDKNDAAFSTVKPQAPYTWGTEVIHAAAVDTYVEKLENLLGRAVGFLQKPENADDLLDPTFSFNIKKHAKGLGFGRRLLLFDTTRDLEYFLNALSEKGLSLEHLAKEYIERSTSDPEATLVSDNDFHHIASLANRDIMLANNVTTQARRLLIGVPAVLQNLIGWSIRRTGSLVRMFARPDGSRNMASVMSAFAKLTFVMAPSALVVAAIKDWWEEEIYGKTPNVLQFRKNMKPLDYVVTTLDRTARVGLGGIAGDLVNAGVNVQTSREFSVDQRIFVINSIMNLASTLNAWGSQGFTNATYETVARPMIQSFGGSGWMQNFVTYKNFFETISGADLETQEDRIVARINIDNTLRAAGRAMRDRLEVRSFGGNFISNPMRPHIKDMQTAAYANNASDFYEAYQEALNAARDMGKKDPRASVASSFGGRNPLRTIFRTDPTTFEYAELLGNMNDSAARTVDEGLSLLNSYGKQIGTKPFFGKKEKPKGLTRTKQRGGLPTFDDYRLKSTLPIFR